MKKFLMPCLLSLLILVSAGWILADVLPKDYRMEPVMRGLASPSAMALAPDGRVLYLERTTGNVRLIRNGKLLSGNYLHVDVATGAEEGLLAIALHPDFTRNGFLYLYYTQLSPKTHRIVRYQDMGNTASGATVILDNIGSSAGGTNCGCGMIFGNDGKLYVSIGDMENSSNAQLLTSLHGKVLRMNDDGSAPSDNPYIGQPYPYNLIYSLGFRGGQDITVNKGVGTIYGTDDYDSDDTCDETNVIRSGNDYGWDTESCIGNVYEAPLHAITPQLGACGLSPYTGSKYPGFANNLFVAGETNGKIIRDVLSGAAYDTYSSSSGFYDPSTESNCPDAIQDLTEGKDGWMYAVSNDSAAADAGIYRVIREEYGEPNSKAREVSASPYLEMTVAKDGSGLRLWWEDLKKDVWGCTDQDKNGACDVSNSKFNKYTVWSGNLTTPFSYAHTVLAETDGDGTSQNDILRSYGIASMPGNNTYYLVSARNANLEGTLGYKTGGVERSGYATTDICNTIGWGATKNKCTNDWGDPVTTPCSPDTPGYPDQNNNCHQIHEFRGQAILLGFEQFN